MVSFAEEEGIAGSIGDIAVSDGTVDVENAVPGHSPIGVVRLGATAAAVTGEGVEIASGVEIWNMSKDGFGEVVRGADQNREERGGAAGRDVLPRIIVVPGTLQRSLLNHGEQEDVEGYGTKLRRVLLRGGSGPIQESRGEGQMRRFVIVAGERDLLEVVPALRAASGFAGLLDGREQEADENRDDGNDDEQLNERESASPGHGQLHLQCIQLCVETDTPANVPPLAPKLTFRVERRRSSGREGIPQDHCGRPTDAHAPE